MRHKETYHIKLNDRFFNVFGKYFGVPPHWFVAIIDAPENFVKSMHQSLSTLKELTQTSAEFIKEELAQSEVQPDNPKLPNLKNLVRNARLEEIKGPDKKYERHKWLTEVWECAEAYLDCDYTIEQIAEKMGLTDPYFIKSLNLSITRRLEHREIQKIMGTYQPSYEKKTLKSMSILEDAEEKEAESYWTTLYKELAIDKKIDPNKPGRSGIQLAKTIAYWKSSYIESCVLDPNFSPVMNYLSNGVFINNPNIFNQHLESKGKEALEYFRIERESKTSNIQNEPKLAPVESTVKNRNINPARLIPAGAID